MRKMANSVRRVTIVRGWLVTVAALIFVMVLVGGATRLTESGLSIVEWKPVTGVLPPLSAAQWQEAFDAYKTIPQYRELNSGMVLDDFKTIFWWEWAHRLLGRVIGAAYLLPFLFFLARGWIPPRARGPLWVIFALGAVQGVVGWWMVASGLSERVEVSQYRLAVHLTLAVIIYAAIVWNAQRLAPAERIVPARLPVPLGRLRKVALVLLGLIGVQVFLGALVAGLRAGRVFNTWPWIDGAFIPSAARLWFETPWWRNLFENALLVQFNHRMLAYVVVVLALWHAADVLRSGASARVAGKAGALATLLVAQAALGIWTLLLQTPLALALAHQGLAMGIVTVATLHGARLTHSRAG
jgi:cytochrome c oxidase assembly protein subunit 15